MALFGGAISLDLPLDGFTDASRFRPVPDFQEVFVSNVDDESIIVELLEHRPDMAVQDYFEQLADETGSEEWTVVESMGDCLLGVQRQTRDSAPTHVLLGLKRLPEHATDCLVSWNCPQTCRHSLRDFVVMLDSFRVLDPSLYQK